MSNIPTLYLIAGHTGAGKSTISKKMAKELLAFYLSHDELLAIAYGDLIGQLDFRECCDRMDKLIWRQANQLFDLKIDLILEGFGTREMREGVKQEAEKIGFHYQLIWVDCPVDERLRRVRERNQNLNDEGYFISDEDFYRMEKANENLTADENAQIIDNSKVLAD